MKDEEKFYLNKVYQLYTKSDTRIFKEGKYIITSIENEKYDIFDEKNIKKIDGSVSEKNKIIVVKESMLSSDLSEVEKIIKNEQNKFINISDNELNFVRQFYGVEEIGNIKKYYFELLILNKYNVDNQYNLIYLKRKYFMHNPMRPHVCFDNKYINILITNYLISPFTLNNDSDILTNIKSILVSSKVSELDKKYLIIEEQIEKNIDKYIPKKLINYILKNTKIENNTEEKIKKDYVELISDYYKEYEKKYFLESNYEKVSLLIEDPTVSDIKDNLRKNVDFKLSDNNKWKANFIIIFSTKYFLLKTVSNKIKRIEYDVIPSGDHTIEYHEIGNQLFLNGEEMKSIRECDVEIEKEE